MIFYVFYLYEDYSFSENEKMTSIKVESNDVDLKFSNFPLSAGRSKPSQFSHAKNGKNKKSAFENIKIELQENKKNTFVSVKVKLQENKSSLLKVDNTEFTTYNNQDISPENDDAPSTNNSTSVSSNTSVEGVTTVNKNAPESLSPDKFVDCSKIHISCRFCKKGFETIKTFRNHDCRTKKSNLKVKMHKCKFCSATFSHKQHLTKHTKGHTRNNCTLCDAQFTKRKALCKHLRTVHNVKESEKLYKCSFCDKHFAKRLSLNFHMKSHIDNQFFCLTCCFVCDDEDTYNEHVKQHLKVSKHECPLCQKKFVRRQQYDQHMMAHEKYLCSSCNITFSNKKLFLKHQHAVHHAENEKKYQCHICKKSFVRPQYLEIHQRVHTGEKPVKCSHCEKNFSDSKSLLKHMKTVKHLQRVSNQKGEIIEIEKPFLCSKCGVRFYRQQSLLRHVEIIHSATEFLKCSHCDYKSKCKTNFKRHLELHTDVKRFICELCGSSFRALATLKEHYVFVHSENREFICEVCKKGFKNKSTLQRHMRIHSESRPYKCFCDRDYKRMSHLKRHMISAHQTTSKKNQMPVSIIENESSNTSLSEESVTAFMKSLEALPDESCDDFSAPHYIATVPRSQVALYNDFPVSHYITKVSNKYANQLNNLHINGESSKEQLSVKIGDDAVPLNSVQKLLDNCDIYVITEDSKNTLNTSDLSQHLKIPPTSMLLNSDTSSTSLDDATLSLSPNNYCNTSSPVTTIPIENITLSQSISSQDVHSLTSIDNIIHPQSPSNLNFQTQTSNIDSFISFSNSDSPSSLPVPPFSLNSSPSHVTDLNLEHNSSQRQLFGVSEDFLSLPSYASNNEFEAHCSPEQFFSWDTDENSNTLKVSNNDLITPSTCANMFSSSLTCNVNSLLPKDLFANDSTDATTLKSEFDSLSNLC